MPRFFGCDVHKAWTEICALDESGQVLFRQRVATTRDALTAFARQHLRQDDELALEATTNTWAVVALLKPAVGRVVVSNPMQTRAIASAKVKTDQIDARVLADLLRCRYLPEIWQPDELTRRQRTLTHARAALVADRTAIKNRIHAVLAERLIVFPTKDLFSLAGRRFLKQLVLDDDGRFLLEIELRRLEQLETEIAAIDRRLNEIAYADPRVLLLMTLPGVGVACALGLLAAWGDTSRFKDAEHAVSYLGLTPSVRQSGDKCYRGSITKQGSSHARWLLIQAAQHLADHPGPLGVFFRRLRKKKNRNVAVVAAARKLALVAWHMLKANEPYRYALPEPTAAKLARLRIQATGERRKSGPSKGSQRPDTFGSGQRHKTIPSLQQVYAGEGVPPLRQLDQLAEGERRILRRDQLDEMIPDLQRSRRLDKRPKPKDVHDVAAPSN